MSRTLSEWLDLSLYGVGQAKPFESLLEEIESGECQITWEGDRYVRLINVVVIDVRSSQGKLVEDCQVFNDGRTRTRNIEGLSEKFKLGESAEDAAKRALTEELGIEFADDISLKFIKQEREQSMSPSYPGLLTRYFKHKFECQLPDRLVQPQYVEVQAAKKTYFNWR